MATLATLATMPWFAIVSPLDNLFLKGKQLRHGKTAADSENVRQKPAQNPLKNVILASVSAKRRQNQRNGGKFGVWGVLFVLAYQT